MLLPLNSLYQAVKNVASKESIVQEKDRSPILFYFPFFFSGRNFVHFALQIHAAQEYQHVEFKKTYT